MRLLKFGNDGNEKNFELFKSIFFLYPVGDHEREWRCKQCLSFMCCELMNRFRFKASLKHWKW